MKKLFLVSVLLGALPFSMMAQDDDLYFTPKKSIEKVSSYQNDDTPAYYSGSNRDVDEYNRHGKYWSHIQKIGSDDKGNDIINFQKGNGVYPDSTYIDTTFVGKYYDQILNDEDYRYSSRMSRWDGFYDPWYYSYRWGYGPYWRTCWRGGWYNPWFDPWYDPWFDPYYAGWYGGWYDPWYYGAWGYPYYYGWGGGYVPNRGGRNMAGFTGSRTWGNPRKAEANRGGQSGVRVNGSRTYGSLSRDGQRAVSFGNRTYNNNSYSNGTRSYGTYSGGGFNGGGHSAGGFSGGAHTISGGGGGHFGNGRR